MTVWRHEAEETSFAPQKDGEASLQRQMQCQFEIHRSLSFLRTLLTLPLLEFCLGYSRERILPAGLHENCSDQTQLLFHFHSQPSPRDFQRSPLLEFLHTQETAPLHPVAL